MLRKYNLYYKDNRIDFIPLWLYTIKFTPLSLGYTKTTYLRRLAPLALCPSVGPPGPGPRGEQQAPGQRKELQEPGRAPAQGQERALVPWGEPAPGRLKWSLLVVDLHNIFIVFLSHFLI